VPRSRERMATVYPSEANLRATAAPSRGPTPTTAAMLREEVDPDTDLSIWGERGATWQDSELVQVSSFELIVGLERKRLRPPSPWILSWFLNTSAEAQEPRMLLTYASGEEEEENRIYRGLGSIDRENVLPISRAGV
jgi:hypothetical protein